MHTRRGERILTNTPTSIRLQLDGNRLIIGWEDGHESRYEGAYLRQMCPCASCRGHAPGEVEPPTQEQVKDVRLGGAEAVGSYAIQFAFSDGHGSGIYSFEHLRKICPSARD